MGEVLTPFQKAGYTEDTVFKCTDECDADYNRLFKLSQDDGTRCPYFLAIGEQDTNEERCFFLPEFDGDVEVYNEGQHTALDKQFEVPPCTTYKKLKAEMEEESIDTITIDATFRISTGDGQEIVLNKKQYEALAVKIKDGDYE